MFKNKITTKLIALIAVLAVPFVTISAQAAEVKIEGVIVSRDGDNLLVRSPAGNVNLTVNKATEIMQTKGLVGVRYETVTADSLIPGLSIKVEAESNGSQTVAKNIKFHVDDMKRASEIQAALVVPQQEAQALKEKTKQQEQVIAAQQQQIEANKAQNEAQDQKMATTQAEVDKRFGELADYDLKDEMTVLFDVNSATLSEQAKADLQAIAAKAKTYKGYLIQVAGYADSTGSASHNQNLSDRRAESVASYLRQSCDVGISRVLAPVAMSTAKPVAANETAQGKAENRRVTVKIAVNRGIAQ